MDEVQQTRAVDARVRGTSQRAALQEALDPDACLLNASRPSGQAAKWRSAAFCSRPRHLRRRRMPLCLIAISCDFLVG